MSARVEAALAEFREAFAKFQQASAVVMGAARRLSVALDVEPATRPDDIVLGVVEDVFGLPRSAIFGSKHAHIVDARWTVFHLCRHVLGWKLQQIADALGVNDHSTVQAALKHFPDRRKECSIFDSRVTECERRVWEQLRKAA